MTAQLARANEFLPVILDNGKDAPVTFYGGDQAWFRTRVGKYSGCGATAAADIFAYLAFRDPQWKDLYHDGSQGLTVDGFRQHMEAVIKYVPPGKIPLVDMPYSGLTSLPRFTRYCDAYLASRNVPLKGHYYSNRETDLQQVTALVEEQLANDNPIALLIMQNRKVKSVAYTDVYGNPAVTDLRFHWVVITSIESKPDSTSITVSSEGARVVVDLDDLWNCDNGSFFSWRGIVYFS
jgi:hypothetical protein